MPVCCINSAVQTDAIDLTVTGGGSVGKSALLAFSAHYNVVLLA